eukprot:2152530-Pyramimonas_sp.AAC.1
MASILLRDRSALPGVKLGNNICLRARAAAILPSACTGQDSGCFAHQQPRTSSVPDGTFFLLANRSR